MPNETTQLITSEKERLLQRMRVKSKSILFVGVGIGLFIIGSVLVGKPLPPAWNLALVIGLAIFMVAQITHTLLLAKTVRRLNEAEKAGNDPA